MNITNFEELNTALQPYVSLVKELTGQNTVIERVKPLMKFLGNPEKKLNVIHIAGTSGKTSTSYYIASLLQQNNLKVGLTVSPHIDKINERVQINLCPLEDELFLKEIGLFLDLVEESKIRPSYFELLYIFAIWIFNKYGVDYAVVETGMGGLHDATNIITSSDKICVITDLGFDHTNILGNTIEEITYQKVGIVHPGNKLIMHKQNDKIMKVIEKWIIEHDASIETIDQEKEYRKYYKKTEINDLPDYQIRNWLLAKKTYDYISTRDNLSKINIKEINQSLRTKIPARMQSKKIDNVNIIMDGAHNPQKMESFVKSFINKYRVKANIILAFKEGKDYPDTLKYITKISDKIYLTKFVSSKDLPAKSIEPSLIAKELVELNFKNFEIIY